MLNQSYFHTMKCNLGDYDLRDLGLEDFNLDFDLMPILQRNTLEFIDFINTATKIQKLGASSFQTRKANVSRCKKPS